MSWSHEFVLSISKNPTISLSRELGMLNIKIFMEIYLLFMKKLHNNKIISPVFINNFAFIYFPQFSQNFVFSFPFSVPFPVYWILRKHFSPTGANLDPLLISYHTVWVFISISSVSTEHNGFLNSYFTLLNKFILMKC